MPYIAKKRLNDVALYGSSYVVISIWWPSGSLK